MDQDNMTQTKQYYSGDEWSVSRDEINSNNYLANSSLNSFNTLQFNMAYGSQDQSLVVFPVEKKKQIKKSNNNQSTKKQSKGQTSKKQKDDSKFNDQQSNSEKQSSSMEFYQQQKFDQISKKNVQITFIPYLMRSKQKFQLSSYQVINMDWFSQDPQQIFDLELYSEFNPIEKVIYHKKQGVFELCQNFLQSQPDNLDYIISVLDSVSSQQAHALAQLIRKQLQKGIQFNKNLIFERDQLDFLKIKTLELIEQLDSQKIFTYQLFYMDPSDNQFTKIIQGYSEGFIKMMGASKHTFSNYVMKHRGFEPFSGKSRLNTVLMILQKELGINPTDLETSAEVKTFDDYILSLNPSISIQFISQQFAVVVSNFDINVNQLLKLESIRKKNNQQLLFQQDFRYQCQAQNFMEKFYQYVN